MSFPQSTMTDSMAKEASPPPQDAPHVQLPPSLTSLEQEIAKRVEQAFVDDPLFKAKSLTTLNNEAVVWFKKGEYVQTVVAYEKLFRRVREENVTHATLHVCYGNRSVAWYRLGNYTQALRDAERSRTLAEYAIRRRGVYDGSYAKSYGRKGMALLAMDRAREASVVLNDGLKIDPHNMEIRRVLEKATQRILEDLLQGKGKEIWCLPSPGPCERIADLAYATPLHRIRGEDMLPSQLLTAQQAERDHHIRDTYNYVTIQTDIRMPLRSVRVLEDERRCGVFAEAVRIAVRRIEERIMEPRVLSLGAGTGLLSMVALNAGAKHVTLVERWLYLALSCKETLDGNRFTEDRYKVVYKRPTDLRLVEDVPICCNICVNELLDEGLLTSGIIPAFRHCLDHLLIQDAILIPASATVYVQAIELRTASVCGLDMSAVDPYRSTPFFTCGLPLGDDVYTTLSDAYEAWYFDFSHPPEESARHVLDITFTRDGIFNAVLFWFVMDLGEGLHFSTAPQCIQQNSSSIRPAVQYLAGQLKIERDEIYPLLCSHNTVRMRFDIEEAEYLHLTKTDPSFPHSLFSNLRDKTLLDAYSRAIHTAYMTLKERDGRMDALDVGCGSGVLGVMCAKAGSLSVVCCDVHPSMIDITRKSIARNHVSSNITAICDDAANLKRGQGVPFQGVNLVVSQLFDSGFLGCNLLGLMDCLRRNVLQHQAIAIPCKAVGYCCGIGIKTPFVCGFDFVALDKYRWDERYSTEDLSRLPHKRLTSPVKVFEFALDGCQSGRGREAIVRLLAEGEGHINAVVFWFDLYLDADTIVTNAPEGIGIDGKVEKASEDDTSASDIAVNRCRHLGQAVQYLDASVEVSKGQKIILIVKRDGMGLTFRLKHGIGHPVERAPWKVQWGGGASVENPHFQRVHYCQLLINDFKMRCKGTRFPSIHEDLKIMYRHCGSLFLDPYSLTEIGRGLTITEKLCQRSELTPCATVESIVGTHLCHC